MKPHRLDCVCQEAGGDWKTLGVPKPRKGNGALLALGSWSQKGVVVECVMKDMVTRRVRATQRRVSKELGSRGVYSLVLTSWR